MRALYTVVIAAAASGCIFGRGTKSDQCPTDRPVEIGLQEDVAKLAGCDKVAAITIRSGAEIDVTPLRELEEITGDLSVGPTVGVDTVALNGLLRVGGTIRIASNGLLRGLYLPRLEQAGRIEVDGNAVLSSISMPRLAAVQGALVITDNNALELVSAPLLTRIGQGLVITGHPKLELVELSKLEQMETLRLEGNPKVPADVVDHLRSKASVPPEAVLARPPSSSSTTAPPAP